jgi:hypothetical protein
MSRFGFALASVPRLGGRGWSAAKAPAGEWRRGLPRHNIGSDEFGSQSMIPGRSHVDRAVHHRGFPRVSPGHPRSVDNTHFAISVKIGNLIRKVSVISLFL